MTHYIISKNYFILFSHINKVYLEAVTWSFTDQKIEQLVVQEENQFLSTILLCELNVLRRSIFSNLLYYLKKIKTGLRRCFSF